MSISIRLVSGLVVDTSVWIDFFRGRTIPALEAALRHGRVATTPVVIAELLSGAQTTESRDDLLEFVGQLSIGEAPIDHWVRVGDLRRRLRGQGISVSIPDAHVAQAALDQGSWLLSRDKIFAHVAASSSLRLWDGEDQL